MNNQVTTTTSGGALRPPVPIPLELNRALMVCRNGLERQESGEMRIDPAYMPTPALRDELRERVRQLGAALDRRDRKDGDGKSVIRAVVARMLEALTTNKPTAEAADVKVGTYRSVLADLPLFAVVEACGRFARGMVAGHNPAFPPTAAEIHVEARKIADPWSAERASILQVLTAKALPPPPSADDRERMLKRIEAWEKERQARAGELDREQKHETGLRKLQPDPFAAWRAPTMRTGFDAEPGLMPTNQGDERDEFSE